MRLNEYEVQGYLLTESKFEVRDRNFDFQFSRHEKKLFFILLQSIFDR